MLALLAAAAVTTVALVAGLTLAVVHAVHPTATAAASRSVPGATAGGSTTPARNAAATDARDALAAAPMPAVPESAAHPGPVSATDPGPPIGLPPATALGPAGVPTGFPHTTEGALAQLAAIDQAALQSGSLAGTRAVIAAWAAPGGPTASSWSGVRAISTLLDATGLSGGGSSQLAVLLTPLMGLIKGGLGPDPLAPDFVVPCVDFELDVTLQQTSRGAVADCQRMLWQGNRWLIGPGAEPATPPSVWPDTDTAIAVGYRDLRRG